MTKQRTGEPWMSPADYGRSLRGLTVNLLVSDVERSLVFFREVLGAEIVYYDPDVAVLRHAEAEWMVHAHHTYDEHPLYQRLIALEPRGVGAELRLHGRDPDEAASAASRLGFTVLQPPTDKGHGLREAYIYDADGYLWVPDIPLPRGLSGARAGTNRIRSGAAILAETV